MGRPKNKDEYRRQMAEAFAGVLEEKGLHWRKEWNGGVAAAPCNGITKACYRGSNAFWLSLVSMMKGYSDPRWVTMNQIMDRDAKYHPKQKWHLKAGSKASYVEYWYPYDLNESKALNWEQYRDALGRGRAQEEFRLSTRYTPVFNACDVEGMPEIPAARKEDIGMDELVRAVSAGMGVPILLDGGDEAYYAPHQDTIHLPDPACFESEYAFNATALHELAHSTGHADRLDRQLTGMFDTDRYAYEELVAEMCSCFMGSGLQQEAGAAHIENHKAYVRTWIEAIRERPESLVRAIRDAQRAASYMDWKAGRITDREYQAAERSSFEVRTKERDRGEAR